MENIESNKVDVEIQLTSKDIVDFSLSFLLKGYKKILYIVMYFIILPPLIFVTIASIIDGGELPIGAIGFAIVLLLLPFLIIRTAKRNYKSHKNLHEPIRYIIDESNVYLKGQTFESTINTENILRVTESKKAFYIWQSNNQANLIPKRFLTQQDIYFFANWIKSLKK